MGTHTVQNLTRASLEFGGSNDYSGVSTSRTLMLKELSTLLATVPADADRGIYRQAIVEENALLKPSAGTRSKTYAFLRDRFALDPGVPVFRLLRMLWDRDPDGQALVALLVAAFRDPLLRSTVPLILERQPDQAVPSRDFSLAIASVFPAKLTDKTLKAAGERISSTFRQTGHLSETIPAIRKLVTPTPGSTTMALVLASLEGAGGQALLAHECVRLLDGTDELILSEARIASSRGWLELRHAGDVLEITFHKLLASLGASP
jgi:hypothetical protein